MQFLLVFSTFTVWTNLVKLEISEDISQNWKFPPIVDRCLTPDAKKLQPEGVWLRKLTGRASWPPQEAWFRCWWTSADSSGHKTRADRDEEEEEEEETRQLRGHDTMILTTADGLFTVREKKKRKDGGVKLECRCDVAICPPGGGKPPTAAAGPTWLVGSPRRWQMWGTILLSVRLWDPNLQKQQQHQQQQKPWTDEQSADGCVSYTFRVEMRQRQRPSLVLLFLCLKPPIIRSHTYWEEAKHGFREKVKVTTDVDGRTEETAAHLWVGSLIHDLQEEGLVLVPNLVLSVPQPVHETWQDWETRELGISLNRDLEMSVFMNIHPFCLY